MKKARTKMSRLEWSVLLVLFAGTLLNIYLLDPYYFRTFDVRSELQFSHGSPYITVDDKPHDVEVLILRPKPGGPLALAGVRDGDIVLGYHATAKLYQDFHENRGSVFTFQVTDGGDGIAIDKRPVRTIRIAVPVKKP